MAPHYAPRGENKFTQTYMFQMGNEGRSVPQMTTDMLTAPECHKRETWTRSQSNSCLASLTVWEHSEGICFWSGRQTHPSIKERERKAQRGTVTFTRSHSRRVAESALSVGSAWLQSLHPPPSLSLVTLSALVKLFQVQNNSISPGQCANTFESKAFGLPLQSAQCP